MEEERFVPSRENPRNLVFLPERGGPSIGGTSNNNKAMPAELIQKPPPPILDRFRALLKEREEELTVSEDDEVTAPSNEEIVRLYEIVLSELTYNSKPIITELTIIAGEQREYGEGIADAICARIIEVPVEQKMPSLYLLDSIVKNIGREYVRCFTFRLPEVFCEAYRQVHPNMYPAMRHLFRTWSAVFPPSVLHKIEVELQFSPPVNHQLSGLTALRSESPSPRPAHGIHINPKYLEARRQFEHSSAANMRETILTRLLYILQFLEWKEWRDAFASPEGLVVASPTFHDAQHDRGISSSLQIYGQKPAVGYGEYDIDHAEVISPQVGAQRSGLPGIEAHKSSIVGAERPLPTSKTRLVSSSSPSRIRPARSLSPSGDGLAMENSPGRVVGRASSSHSGFEYGVGRVSERDRETNDWWMKHWSDGGRQHIETSSAYNLSNGCDQQGPRALIDAYGHYRSKSTLNEKPLKLEWIDVNGMNGKATMGRWQNSEEEEYVWEDMSPTLADRSRSTDLMPSNPSLGSLSTRTGLRRPNAALLEPDFRRDNWPRQAQPSVVDDSAFIAEDGVSILGPGRGTMSGPGTRRDATQIHGSHYSQEPWNLPHYFPQSSKHLNPKASGRAVKMSIPSSGIAPSVGQKVPSLVDNVPDTEAQFQRLPSVMSRMGSSGTEPLKVEVLSPLTPASTVETHLVQRPHSPPMQQLLWPPLNVRKSHPLPLLPTFPRQQQLDALERKALSSSTVLQLPNQQAGLISLNQRNQGLAARLRPQQLQPQEAQERVIPSIPAQVSSHLMAQTWNHGHTQQGHGAVMSTISLNKIPGIPHSSVTIHSMPNTSFHLQGGALPPLPPGPPPGSSQMRPTSQIMGPIASHPPASGAFSGLISSLMAQGVISLTTPGSVEDSVGVEFNPDLLKVRHESAINALYNNLPRQCTTCGLRFNCQEEHRNHMDWHVTKNRISKNRKQTSSRKWFVSTSVWLSGTETLGSDAVPGFLPTEAIVENKDDEEMAVPADENQNVCALCGEPFDDFYSDETEEWMYRGAVYMNAPDGSTVGMDRSQLGPIVHVKCRSESTVISSEDFVLDEGGNTEEGSQRKKMRI